MNRIAVIHNSKIQAFDYIKNLIPAEEINEIIRQSLVIKTLDGRIFIPVTRIEDILGCTFKDVIVCPNYESFVDLVRSRIR